MSLFVDDKGTEVYSQTSILNLNKYFELKNKMAAPKAFVHHDQNRLRYHFAISPTNECCEQR